MKYYTIGITYSDAWLRVDPGTGQWEMITKLDDHMHDQTLMYDLAYSVYDGEMWGLVQNNDGQIKSRIGVVSLEDSEVSDMVQLPDYYFAISFDYDGFLYGIRWEADAQSSIIGTRLDKFDRDFKVVESFPVLVDGQPYKPYYQHGLDFDYSTGDLIWAATDNRGYQKMVRINPDNGETENFGTVGFNELMVGLHVPFKTAESREAPALVKDLSFTTDPDGECNVTLSWTNPSTKWNRTELDNLSTVKIFRDGSDGAPIAEIDAAGMEGKEMSFTDKEAPSGVNIYHVVACNDKGAGVPDSIEAFVGRDTPGPVTDLSVSSFDDGRSVKIEWKAPVRGDSEGWFDRNITYDVTRYPGGVKVAERTSSLYAEDKDIEEAMLYTYEVTSYNPEGKGSSTVSEGILAGAALAVPFRTEFANANEANRFLSFDEYGSKNTFRYVANNSRPVTMAMYYEYQNTNHAILSSPCLNLIKGRTYRVTWRFTFNRFGASYEEHLNHFRVLGGQKPNERSMTKVLGDYPDRICEKISEDLSLVTYFESPVDGDYCVGFNVNTQSKCNDAFIYVTEFEIVEAPENDLEVTSFFTPAYVSSVDINRFDVTVYNNGLAEQSDYKVQVGVARLDGGFIPFAETDAVPALKSRESATIRVEGTASGGIGVQDLAARVVLDGDQTSANDMSDFREVEFFDGDAFNYHADDPASRWNSSNIPFTIFTDCSASQTPYAAAMLGIPDEGGRISGLAWEYSADKDIELDVKVWLAVTDTESFPSSGAKWADSGNMLVYDGRVSLPEGEDRWMRIDFPDREFHIPGGRDLMVTVAVSETANTGNDSFPLMFNIWNSPDAGHGRSDGKYHTIMYRGGVEFDFTPTPLVYEPAPVLHLSLASGAGVGSITDDAALPGLVVSGRVANVSGGVVSLEVYGMDGRLVESHDMTGRGSVTLSVTPGIYLVRAVDGERASRIVRSLVK